MTKFLSLTAALLSSMFLFTTLYGQTEKQRIDAYVNQYKDFAIGEMQRTGIPAAVTLAQGILETGGGQSDLAALANNHFGIKCKSEWTGETMLHNDDAKDECFRKYASVEDSYKDHSEFLKSRPCYSFLFKLDPTDFEGWAKGLKRAGYATNPAYAQKLIKLIVENNLQNYTLLALNRASTKDDMLAYENNSTNNAQEGMSNSVEIITANAGTAMKISEQRLQNVSYPVNSVFDINELKVIYAEAGTSLLALANNYSIPLKKLLNFNELDRTDILSASQLIYLEKKSKKGREEIHIVEKNETLRDISQKEGMQLTTILEYNGLQKGMEPAAGEKIYLKYPAPSSPRLSVARGDKTVAGIL